MSFLPKKNFLLFFAEKYETKYFTTGAIAPWGHCWSVQNEKYFFFRNEKEENVVARKWVEDICFNSRSKKKYFLSIFGQNTRFRHIKLSKICGL